MRSYCSIKCDLFIPMKYHYFSP